MSDILDINYATNSKVVREFSSEEIAQRLADSEAKADADAAILAKATAKASAIAKLQELGLTVEEVSAAFGLEAE